MKALKPVKFNTPVTGQFIRGSTATYIEDGILKTAAINEPRWQNGELFLEREATNLLPAPEAFDSVTWVKQATTVTPNLLEPAPNGVQYVVDAVFETAATAQHDIYATGASAQGKSFSVFVKPVGRRYIGLYGYAGGIVCGQTFDLVAGVVGSPWTGVAPVDTILQPLAGGWWRIGITSAVLMDIGAVIFCDSNVTGIPVYAGNPAAGAYLWGAMMNTGGLGSYTTGTRAADVCVGNFSRASTATYIDASGVIQTAGVNVPRIQYNKLLIEPASTNLATFSELFSTSWSVFNATTFTDTTSPTGANTAKQLNETAVTGTHGTSQIITVSGAGKTFTASIFAKARTRANFHFELGQVSGSKCVINTNLTTGVQTKVTAGFDGETYGIQFIGNGWYRIWITAKLVSFNSPYVQLTLSTDGVTTNYAGVAGNGIDIFGGQLEESTFVTSYIPTTTTAVTRSADLHTAGIVYSNAVESTASWSSATTYSVGQKVRYNNTIYESLQGTNLNKQPDTNPTWWLSLGADNITAAIDGKVGTKTVATDKLRMIVYPDSAIDAVGYIECSANSISTSAVDTDYNVVYSYKTGLSNESIDNWYDYFFIDPLGDPFTQVVHQGVNSLDSKLVVGVEMTRSGSVELGLIVAGQTTDIGKTQYGLRAGIVDYSKKEADEFGNVTIVERTYSKRLEGDVYVYNYDLNKVQRFLYNVRATPVLWIASDDTELAEVSNVYGFYKDFSTTIAYPDVSMCSLQIEGLT